MKKTKDLLFEVQEKIKTRKGQEEHWKQVYKMLKEVEEAERTYYHEHKREVINGQ